VIHPISFAHASLYRAAKANGADMAFVRPSLAVAALPLIPLVEGGGRIAWRLATGQWPSSESIVLLGRDVSASALGGLFAIALTALWLDRHRERLAMRYGAFPVPNKPQVAALAFGLAAFAAVVGYLSQSWPWIGTALFALSILGAAVCLTRIERRLKRAADDAGQQSR
jgi:hypothetical protein